MFKHGKSLFRILELSLPRQVELDDVDPTPLQPDVNKTVVRQNTPLSFREMFRLSQRIADKWATLAGFMAIPMRQRREIECNFFAFHGSNQPWAEKVLWIVNQRENFSREDLTCGLRAIGQEQWIEPILTGKWRCLRPMGHL